MDEKQKQYILEHHKKLPLKQIAKNLNLKEKNIAKYLDKIKFKLAKQTQSYSGQAALDGIQPIKTFLILSTIAVLGFVIYSNSFSSAFLYDDLRRIVNNYRIQDITNLNLIWIGSTKARFIPFYTFAINYHFHQLNVFGYHLINLLTHLGCSMLVYLFVRLIFRTPKMAYSSLKNAEQLIALSAAILLPVSLLIFFEGHP